VDSNFVSSIGEFVDRFEGMLAEFTGVKKAVLCVNGTAALHICLKMSRVERDDEVLIPALVRSD
jgi:perosamine synthetase